jgi:hypothetical protein
MRNVVALVEWSKLRDGHMTGKYGILQFAKRDELRREITCAKACILNTKVRIVELSGPRDFSSDATEPMLFGHL